MEELLPNEYETQLPRQMFQLDTQHLQPVHRKQSQNTSNEDCNCLDLDLIQPANSIKRHILNWKKVDSPSENATSDFIEQILIGESIERLFKYDPDNLIEDYNMVYRDS